jgi:hypothetical protein
MNAPFYKFGLFGDEASFIVAFAIGIGFGFFLERAGFGSGRKLAAQFYFRDLSVLKVMFTGFTSFRAWVWWICRWFIWCPRFWCRRLSAAFCWVSDL